MKTYLKNKIAVRGKPFALGDQDGFVSGSLGEKVPFVRTVHGNTYAEFGSHYYVIEPGGDKQLIPNQRFAAEYSEVADY